MDIPSVESLHQERDVRERHKNDLYNIVLEKCVERIKQTNKLTNYTYTFFQVPEFLIGYTDYNIRNCVIFLMRKLRDHGYHVELVGNYLRIDWGSRGPIGAGATIEQQRRERFKKQADEIMKKHPGAKVNFIYK